MLFSIAIWVKLFIWQNNIHFLYSLYLTSFVVTFAEKTHININSYENNFSVFKITEKNNYVSDKLESGLIWCLQF